MGHVGSGAVVIDSVIGADASVADGERLAGVRRPDPDAS
jgi:hypothetical protein